MTQSSMSNTNAVIICFWFVSSIFILNVKIIHSCIYIYIFVVAYLCKKLYSCRYKHFYYPILLNDLRLSWHYYLVFYISLKYRIKVCDIIYFEKCTGKICADHNLQYFFIKIIITRLFWIEFNFIFDKQFGCFLFYSFI